MGGGYDPLSQMAFFKQKGQTVNPILWQFVLSMVEQLGIPAVIDLLIPLLEQNPATLAQYRQALLAAADGIYRAYAITPPTHS